MNNATRLACLLTFAVCAGASAQRIEISSESIGTVVVTPPVIDAGSNSSRSATAPRSRNSQRTGVDLGIQRRPDGSLYDPLDSAQNPAAATAPSVSERNAPATGPANAAAGANNANAAAGGLAGMAAANATTGNATLPANGYGTGATLTTANRR